MRRKLDVCENTGDEKKEDEKKVKKKKKVFDTEMM